MSTTDSQRSEPKPLDRTERTELLAAADRSALVSLADRCLDGLPDPTLLTRPEVGTVVLTVREPVEETRLHLGDVLVTRTELAHRDARGWAMRMGDDVEAALAAAVCDAEAEAGGPLAAEIDDLCRETDRQRAAARRAEWDELAPTAVSFEEMEL